MKRRDFLSAGAIGSAALWLDPRQLFGAEGGLHVSSSQSRPVVVGSSNGLRGAARALEMIRGGGDPLDAAVAGVEIQELDPEDTSVGLGGLPNEEGIVQLDASCMHGPTRRGGAVAALEGIATPARVAKAVMDHTDHILLVGEGAKKFALRMGFTEQNLLTERARRQWLRWRSRLNPHDNWLDVDDQGNVQHQTGTVHLSAVTAAGDIASVTSTSGLAWKLAGRVGDSPLVGAGQYCDNTVGAAGSTGRGEANIKACGAFLTVELMRSGASPQEACLRTLERVVAMTERRLLDDRGRPRFGLLYYAVAKDGRYGGASMYEGSRFAVADARGGRLEDCAFLFRREERPR